MTVDTEIETPKRTAAEAQTFKIQRRQARTLKLFEPALVKMATLQSFVMLDPRNMMRNPVMFLVEVGTVLTAIVTVQSILYHAPIGSDRLPDRAHPPPLDHGPLCQLRRGARRGTRQGPGRQPPRHTPGHPRLSARRPRDGHGAGRFLYQAPRRRLRRHRDGTGDPHRRRGRPGSRLRRSKVPSPASALVIREAGGDHSGRHRRYATRVLS